MYLVALSQIWILQYFNLLSLARTAVAMKIWAEKGIVVEIEEEAFISRILWAKIDPNMLHSMGKRTRKWFGWGKERFRAV